MKKTKTKNQGRWFLLALLGALLAAPNPTFVKLAGDFDPYLLNALRFGLIAVLTLPLLLINLHKFSRKNLKLALLGGLFLTGASFTFVLAVHYSQASYVPVITLLIPVNLIVLSAKITGEKVSRRAILGVLLAAIGALVVVALPVALHQSGEVGFYPLATVLALLDSMFFPLAVIYFKKANDGGLPISTVMNLSAWMILLVGLVAFNMTAPQTAVTLSTKAVVAILYSGLGVMLIARSINVITYEHVGSAIVGSLEYLENLLAILIPVIILHETLSIEMVLGSALILLGVYVAEYHKAAHHKHHRNLRHH